MSANQAAFPIATMAHVLGVSEAGYYAWLKRPPSAHAVADAALLKRVRTIHASSRETYGSPRVHAELQAAGAAHGRKRVARLMHAAGLVGASRRRAGVSTTKRDKGPGRRQTWWTGTSRRQRRTSSGSQTSRSCLLRRGSSTSLSCWTPGAASQTRSDSLRWWAGRWPTTCAPSWCWPRWRWRSANGGQRTSSTTRTRGRHRRPWGSATGARLEPRSGSRACGHP